MISLSELCVKDKEYRKIALKICGCPSLADDLVQELYLICADGKIKDTNMFYLSIIMRNMFYKRCKQEKKAEYSDFIDTTKSIEEHNQKDRQTELIELYTKEEITKANNLTWLEKEILKLSHDMSSRQIQEKYNINRMFVQRIIKKAKNKIHGTS